MEGIRKFMGRLNSHSYNTAVRYAFDIAALIAAWYCTIELRVFLNLLFVRQLTIEQLRAVSPPASFVVLMWLFACFWLRLHGPNPRTTSKADMLMNAMESVALANILTIVTTFFFREIGTDLSRSFAILFLPISLAWAVVARYAAMIAMGALDGRAPERVAVIGHGKEAWRIAECVSHSNQSAVLAGMILPRDRAEESTGSTKVLGTTSKLAELINRTGLDRIIIVNGCVTDTEIDECGVISRRMGIVMSRAMPVPLTGVRLGLSEHFGVPLLELRPVAFTRRQEIIKRTFDIVVAALALIVLSPLLVAVALAIRFTSPGDIFYLAPRVGKGGRYFPFIKFRSMHTDRMARSHVASGNEKDGKLFKIKNDPRVTPVGRFIRKYSIDELPQLVNVLRGEMSLVGPRPLPAEDLDPDGQSQEFAAWSEQRSRVLPGISGLWQVRGRSNLSFEQMIELDIEYIRNWSLDLDMRILLVTPKVVITGRGAC
jgi:exopolysaccharide biosynthesis polyprenyl glycosylphosphotransferase